MNTQHKENIWPAAGKQGNASITFRMLLEPDCCIATITCEEGGIREKAYVDDNKNHWSDIRGAAKAMVAKYKEVSVDANSDDIRQLAELLSAFKSIEAKVTYDSHNVKDIHGPPIPPRIRLVPEPAKAKVDMWDGWDDKYERMLTLPVMHGYGGDYQGFPHKDVIKCWVEKQDVPKGDKPVFLLPQKKAGFPNISENMATFGEGEAEKKRRYEFNQTRGKTNG